MTRPEIRYALSGDVYVAYQVFGDGPVDLVLVTEWLTPLDARWDVPMCSAALERLGRFARVISFDKRGIGCSDPVPIDLGSTPEAWMDDIRVVMDAVSSERAAIMGAHDGGPVAMLFAATYPDRTSHLILANTGARRRRAPDYPWGLPDELIERAGWESPEGMATTAPEGIPYLFGDRRLVEWADRARRAQASPTVAAAIMRMTFGSDVREVLPSIQAPTLVLHREHNRQWLAEHGRYLRERIAGARYVELPGSANIWWGEDPDRMVDEIEEFLTGTRGATATDRVLATVLFTDIVASTQTTAELGDRKWRELIDAHDATVRRELERHGGRFVGTSGDSVLATFDGPARAIRCARAITDAVSEVGLEVRVGLHAGEVELRGDDVAGISVNLAHRVMELASAKEVLVSRTVVDLVAGSGIGFDDRGEHELKGVPGRWQVFAVRS